MQAPEPHSSLHASWTLAQTNPGQFLTLKHFEPSLHCCWSSQAVRESQLTSSAEAAPSPELPADAHARPTRARRATARRGPFGNVIMGGTLSRETREEEP